MAGGDPTDVRQHPEPQKPQKAMGFYSKDQGKSLKGFQQVAIGCGYVFKMSGQEDQVC